MNDMEIISLVAIAIVLAFCFWQAIRIHIEVKSLEKRVNNMVGEWANLQGPTYRQLYIKGDWKIVSRKTGETVNYSVLHKDKELFRSSNKNKAFAELKKLQDEYGKIC